jgi:hypothetical protein|tara:strand:+ start:1980 stop:2822 length:843 start_codon:yes stop_codon:yes gene_type:complete
MGIDKINNQDFPQSTTAPATTTPSVSLAGGAFGVVTATITKSGGGTYTNPNYSAQCALADGTVTVTDANIDRNLESDASHLAGTLNFTDTNASTAERTITVKAQEFVDRKQSAGATATYTPSYIQKKYIRIRGVDEDGNDSSQRSSISNIRFYTGTGQSGTEYPTTNLTSATSETGIVVSAGHEYSSTYPIHHAVNGAGNMWWALGTTAANNWWQIEFEDATYSTKPIIKSMTVTMPWNTTSSAYFKITGSDNADHSSATDFGVYATNIISGTTTAINIG